MLKSRSLPRQRSIEQDKTNSRFSPRLPLFGGAFFLRDTRAAHRARRELARPQDNQGRKQGRKASKVASSTPDPSSTPDHKI